MKRQSLRKLRNVNARIIAGSCIWAAINLLAAFLLIVLLTDVTAGKFTTIMVSLSMIIICGQVIFSIFILKMINNAVSPVLELSHSVAEGDLVETVDVRSDDIIGKLAKAQNAMVLALRNILVEIKDASNQVSATAEELAASSSEIMLSAEEVSTTVEQISKGAETQVFAVEETSNVVTEISKMASQVADRVKQSTETARTANEIARRGSADAEQAATKMIEMKNAMDDVTIIVQGLGERSMQIGLVVDVITNITDQTSMLALNAAIEASRAGEQGRGFAVVAEEVRNLADGSRKAADQIAKMMHDTERETQKALQSMSSSMEIVDTSTEVIQSTLNALTNIAGIVEEIADGIQLVYDVTETQREGSSRVVKAAHDIADIAEKTASGTQEAAAAANEQTASMQEMKASIQELAKLAIEMKNLVDGFTLVKME